MLNMDLSVHDFDGRAFDTLRRELNLAPASSYAPGADELVIFEIYSWCDARWRKIHSQARNARTRERPGDFAPSEVRRAASSRAAPGWTWRASAGSTCRTAATTMPATWETRRLRRWPPYTGTCHLSDAEPVLVDQDLGNAGTGASMT